MSFDWEKPFTTKDGHEARLLGSIAHDFAPNVVAVTNDSGKEEVYNYRLDGIHYPMSTSCLNLINILDEIKPFHLYRTRNGETVLTGANHINTISFTFKESGITKICFSYGTNAGRLNSSCDCADDLVELIGPVIGFSD